MYDIGAFYEAASVEDAIRKLQEWPDAEIISGGSDVSKESLKNNIGLKFAFRSTDINEIKQTLEFFGIDKDDENNQKRLRDLENGQCLLQDLYGRVGVVQIHPVFEELLHAFDTRPPVQRNEVE